MLLQQMWDLESKIDEFSDWKANKTVVINKVEKKHERRRRRIDYICKENYNRESKEAED